MDYGFLLQGLALVVGDDRRVRFVVLTALIVVLSTTVLSASAYAQVTTTIIPDSNLPTHTTVTKMGNIHDIEAGTIKGRNQFHSFGQFDLGAGDVASFNGPATIANILSRVTGGIPSEIDGTLRSTIEGANLFFLNPAGVVFGPEAKLDLTGSFHVSTANFLRFEDGASFYADANLDDQVDSILTVAPREDFGFLNKPITMNFTSQAPGSITFEGSNLQVTTGNIISVVGGDVTMNARELGNESRSSRLAAEGGVITVASVKSVLEVPVDMREAEINTITGLGDVTLSENTQLTTSGAQGGTVVIRGGRLVMDDAEISVSTGDVNGARLGIDIQTEREISLNNNSRITSNALGLGNAGSILLRTPKLASGVGPLNTGVKLRVKNPKIEASTSNTGNAGNIVLNVETLEAANTEILSLSTGKPTDSGSSGKITIEGLPVQGAHRPSEQIILTDSQVDTIIAAGKEGGGDILITSKNFALNSTGVRADTNGIGDAGNITFNVEKLTAPDSFLGSRSRSPEAGGGDAGNITIQGLAGEGSAARTISFPSDARVTTEIIPPNGFGKPFSEFKGDGKGGQIKVMASESILLQGTNLIATVHNRQNAKDTVVAGVTVVTPNLTMGVGGFKAATTGSRDAGNINATISKKALLIDDRFPKIEASTSGTGNAGNIVFEVGELVAVNAEFVSLSTNPNPGSGDAGRITIGGLGSTSEAPTPVPGPITVTDTKLSTAVAEDPEIPLPTAQLPFRGDGQGGTIQIVGADDIVFTNSSLSTNVNNAPNNPDANVASIAVKSESDIVIQGETTITAESLGTAPSGNVTLNAEDSLRVTDSVLTTSALQAEGDNQGGDLSLNAQSLIQVVDSTLKSDVAGGPDTRGGNIKLDPQFVAVHNSTIQSTATAGSGGTISISADEAVFIDTRTVLDVGSQFGGSGTVNVQAPLVNLSGTIVPLPDEVLKVSSLYSEHCFAQKDGSFSSFVLHRGKVTREPGGFLLSPLVDHTTTSTLSNRGLSSRTPLAAKRLGIGRMIPKLELGPVQRTSTLFSRPCIF